jgi:uncharacterized protein (TIGR02246 family)
MTMTRIGTFVLVASVALAGTARGADLKAEEASLMKRDAEWSAVAYEAKDLEKILSFWTDDAVVIPSGGPVADGKAAIRAFVQGALAIPGFKIRWTTTKATLSPDGKFAYLQSTTETTVNGQDGKPQTMDSRATTVWRKDPDGLWRCVLDTWNEATPAGAAQ